MRPLRVHQLSTDFFNSASIFGTDRFDDDTIVAMLALKLALASQGSPLGDRDLVLGDIGMRDILHVRQMKKHLSFSQRDRRTRVLCPRPAVLERRTVGELPAPKEENGPVLRRGRLMPLRADG